MAQIIYITKFVSYLNNLMNLHMQAAFTFDIQIFLMNKCICAITQQLFMHQIAVTSYGRGI